MQSFRSFSIGMQVVNGYTVNIERVVSAQQTGVKSRIAAKYYGTITDLDGNEISLGVNGKTSPQIKQIIGLSTATHNNGDKVLNSLKKAFNALQSAGLDTAEVSTKIAEREQELQEIAEREQVLNEARKQAKKAQKQQLAKLQKAKKALQAAGLDTTAVDEQIAALN